MNACKNLINKVLNLFRTNTSQLTETVAPVVAKTKERMRETLVEAESIAQELKGDAEQHMADAYDKAVNVGHQAAGILDGSKEQLEGFMEEIKQSSEKIVAGARARTFKDKVKAAAAKAPAAKTAPKTKKAAATAKAGKPVIRKTGKTKPE